MNKYILIFIALFVLVLSVVWKIVQSETFANLAVSEISERFIRDENLSFEFESVGVSIFPPATTLHNLSLVYVGEETEYNVQVNKVSIEFNFINMLASELVVEKFQVDDSKIIQVITKEEEGGNLPRTKVDQREITEKLSNILNTIHKNIPVKINSLALNRSEVEFDQYSFHLDQAELRLYQNYLIGDVYIEEIEVPENTANILKTLADIDSVRADIELSDSYINFSDIELKRKLDKLSGEIGYRFDNKIIHSKLLYQGGSDWPVEELNKRTEENINLTSYVEAQVISSGEIDGLQHDIDIGLEGLKSHYALADDLDISVNINDGVVSLNNFFLTHNQGRAQLIDGVEVFNLKTKKIIENKVKLIFSNLKTHTAFHAIRKELGIVDGRLNGEVWLSWNETSEEIIFETKNEVVVENFLLGDNRARPILAQERLVLDDTTVNVSAKGDVVIASSIEFQDSRLDVKGRVGGGEVAFVTSRLKIDFEQLGPISGFQIIGHGTGDLRVFGPNENVVFKSSLELEEVEVLGFNLGNTNVSLEYKLNKNQLQISELKGNQLGAQYNGNGEFYFSDREEFGLNFSFDKLNYDNSKVLLEPLIDLLPMTPSQLSYLAKAHFLINGSYEVDSLNIEGNVTASYIDYRGETFDDLVMDVSYGNESLSLSDISLRKSESRAVGRFFMDFKNDFLEYEGSWKDIGFSDFDFYRSLNLGLETDADLFFNGRGRPESFKSTTELKTKNSEIGIKEVGPSIVKMTSESDKVEFEASVFDRLIRVRSLIDLREDVKENNSKLEAEFNITDLKTVLGVISGHNLDEENLGGRLIADLKSSFNIFKPENLDLTMDIRDFLFLQNDLALELEKDKLLIKLEKGEFIDADISLVEEGGRDFYFRSRSDGFLGDGFSSMTNYKVPARVLDILSQRFQVTAGEIEGQSSLGGSLGEIVHLSEIILTNGSVQSSLFPGSLDSIKIKLRLDEDNLAIDELQAVYGKGNVTGQGIVQLRLPYPTISITVEAEDAFIPFMQRSGAVISGDFEILGNEKPYTIQGDVSVLFAEVLEEINEFQKRQGGVSSYERFLPRVEGSVEDIFLMNLDVDLQRPIQVRNSLLELNILGNASIKGPPSRPQPSGFFEVVESNSKFKFKGHEFNLTKGIIDLGKNFNREGALIDFSGVTDINEYSIRLDVTGRTKNVEVSLSSEPGLSQEDIFSLLTLGVTSEVSTELDENERQSVATVGLGALLADQLKLNEGLDSSFGLRLSVLPEYAEESESLLQGRSGVTDSTTSRFKSSTRVRVQKRVNEKVDISVSSTIGGSLDQRQEMNVNYKIDNQWSLQGVYELKSIEDEGVESTDSIGADLKYRWSF